MDEPMEGAVRRGEEDLGRLRFAPGRRSVAQAETGQTEALVLTAGLGGVEVRRRRRLRAAGS